MVQDSEIQYLQGTSTTTATANGNGTICDGGGITGAIQVEVVESNGGTFTLALQGSFDGGTNWYAVGYQQVDNTAAPARAVANLSVLANSAHVYQILDPYPKYRAVVSSVAASPHILVRAYVVPA